MNNITLYCKCGSFISKKIGVCCDEDERFVYIDERKNPEYKEIEILYNEKYIANLYCSNNHFIGYVLNKKIGPHAYIADDDNTIVQITDKLFKSGEWKYTIEKPKKFESSSKSQGTKNDNQKKNSTISNIVNGKESNHRESNRKKSNNKKKSNRNESNRNESNRKKSYDKKESSRKGPSIEKSRKNDISKKNIKNKPKNICEFYLNNGYCIGGDRCYKDHNITPNYYKFDKNKFLKSWKDNPAVLQSHAFDKLIEDQNLNLKLIESIIENITDNDFLQSIEQSIITKAYFKLITTNFMCNSIPKYLSFAYNFTTEQAKKCILFFTECLNKFSSDSISMIRIVDLVYHFENWIKDSSILQEVKMLKERQNNILINAKAQWKRNINLEFDNGTLNEIQDISLVPTYLDFVKFTKPPKNMVKNNQFTTVQQLINTHFKLQREDFMSNLRDGFKSYTNSINSKSHHSFSDLPVFTHVFLEKFTMDKYNFDLYFQITFKYPKKIKWASSKLLQHGNLVCLFPTPMVDSNTEITSKIAFDIQESIKNNEKDPICCIVLDRVEKKENDIKLLLIPYSDSDIYCFLENLASSFILFESPCYFKSVEPVLKSLKSLNEDTLPFKDILLCNNLNPEMPEYIKNCPNVDISIILKDKSPTKFVDLNYQWIPEEISYLDSSQLKSLKHILTNKVSMIQGPPGTGKTFLGVRAAKIILKHLSTNYKNKRPIVFICYTNHALDQMLEHLIDDVPDLIRIGSRSKSENERLLSRNINSLIKVYDREISQLKWEFNELSKEIKSIFSKLQKLKHPIYAIQLQSQLLDGLKEITKFGIPFKLKNAFEIWYNGTELEKQKEYANKFKKNDIIEVEADDSFQDSILHENFDDNEVNIKNELKNLTKINNKKHENVNDDESQDTDSLLFEQEQELIELEKDRKLYEMHYSNSDDDSISNEEYEDEYSNDYINYEYNLNGNIWNLNIEDRKNLITNILQDYYNIEENNFFTKLDEFKLLKEKREELIQIKKLQLLINAPIVGLTSTGAALNRNLLIKLKPQVLIIEEVGELLESQVLSCLHPNLQHLIMIGDEKQLRPKVNSYNLEKEYDFAISLFERLIMGGVSKVSLNVQLRMRPEISNLTKQFYSDVNIKDHPRVLKYPNIAGIKENVLFMMHTHPEKEDLRSKINIFESNMVTNFVMYLLKQKVYTEKNITILTPYKGQVYQIRSDIRKCKSILNSVQVVSIDDYQGEENDIIIISLVRSNKDNKAGFLSIQNRIIVLLSRAKYGLYIFGNSNLLEHVNDWYNVILMFKSNNILKDHLPLCCQKHQDKITIIKQPNDFASVPEGGCLIPCDFVFDCGHTCPLKCHPFNEKHNNIKCKEKCLLKYENCEHKCQNLCHYGKKCSPCKIKISYTFPICNHVSKIECGINRNELFCYAKCNKILPCGHKCKSICGQCQLKGYCPPCNSKVNSECQECHRLTEHVCGKDYQCNWKCIYEHKDCGHSCSGKCYECKQLGKHKPCHKPCDKILICGCRCKGHDCSIKSCPPCENDCKLRCKHGKCTKKCNSLCITMCRTACNQKCSCKNATKCSKECHEICDIEPCNLRCPKKLNCKHQCQGYCGEPCPPCPICELKKNNWKCLLSLSESDNLTDTELLYKLPCNCVFLGSDLDRHMKNKIEENTISYLFCPNDECKEIIFVAPRYQKQIKLSIKKIEELKKYFIKQQEMKNIISAINSFSHQGGAWYKCSNGHFYYIGECGGAMEKAICPECKEVIGGSDHVHVKSSVLIGQDVEDVIEIFKSNNKELG